MSALPRVTVLLCVYNGAAYLQAALDSLWAQTVTDFELVVVDDGSTDETPAILARCADPRLRVVRQENAGLTRALNRGLREARGEYLARQDADDLSAPERLQRQVAFLDAHPDVALVGTGIRVVDEAGRAVAAHRYPAEHAALRAALLRRVNPLPHSSVMLRREAAVALGGWDERFVKAQDYEFNLRLSEARQIASLPELLVSVRFHPDSLYGSGNAGEQLKYALLAHALAALRRDHPGRVPPRDTPLPLAQFEAWYRTSPYPAHFAAGRLRREARLAWSRGAYAAALGALARVALQDPLHWPRHLLRLPDRGMIELARQFERWV